MLEKIARKMTQLGFTLYEAKAYICFRRPATNYLKKAGCPVRQFTTSSSDWKTSVR